jgi:hypothetical protein
MNGDRARANRLIDRFLLEEIGPMPHTEGAAGRMEAAQ